MNFRCEILADSLSFSFSLALSLSRFPLSSIENDKIADVVGCEDTNEREIKQKRKKNRRKSEEEGDAEHDGDGKNLSPVLTERLVVHQKPFGIIQKILAPRSIHHAEPTKNKGKKNETISIFKCANNSPNKNKCKNKMKHIPRTNHGVCVFVFMNVFVSICTGACCLKWLVMCMCVRILVWYLR